MPSGCRPRRSASPSILFIRTRKEICTRRFADRPAPIIAIPIVLTKGDVRSWPVASHIALEPNVGLPGIAEVAGAFQDRETPVRSRSQGRTVTPCGVCQDVTVFTVIPFLPYYLSNGQHDAGASHSRAHTVTRIQHVFAGALAANLRRLALGVSDDNTERDAFQPDRSVPKSAA